jgi:mannosyltransferase
MTTASYVRRRPAGPPPDTATGMPAGRVAGLAARVPWAPPAVLTLALGCYQVGRPELWRDELSSWSVASRPVSGLIATARSTGATQLAYYLLLHFWIAAFGDSADAMRSLSVLAMAGAAACVTLVGRKLAGTRAGVTSGLVFALVPSVSRFAQEVRFYALEVLVATLATLLLLRALERPSRRRWLGYAAAVAFLGYVDLVALSVVAGHAAGAALRWRRDRDGRQLRFIPAAAAGLAACVPLAVIGWAQAGDQVSWIPRPGVALSAFTFFGFNLFYSSSVAAALIILALVAWTVARREAEFATAVAIIPVAVVWLVSQGPHSYFYPRYLLLTVGAWAILAGICLSRLDLRIAVAALLIIAALGAGDQQAVRALAAHSWPSYPEGSGASYLNYAAAAAVIAARARPGDGIVYQEKGRARPMLIDTGVEYYLDRDLRPGVPIPRELFIRQTAVQADGLYAVQCKHPALCLGSEPRIWIVGWRNLAHTIQAVTPAQETILKREGYRLRFVARVAGLTVFLMVRT